MKDIMQSPAKSLWAILAISVVLPSTAQSLELEQIADFFANANIVSGPELVDCTLSEGTKTQCFSITVIPRPAEYTPGPWCPAHISDGPDAGGLWIVDGEMRDVDGQFITSLAEIYGDTNWKLYDEETGNVRYTGTLEACEAAARPDVDEAYQNYCVQCLPEYMPDDASNTYVIPLSPVMAKQTGSTRAGGSGLAYNGVRLDGPAPVDAILSAYTIAAFDDCGGHVNTHVGYHYHAVTDCLDNVENPTIEADDHGSQIGIAMDGVPILSRLLADGTEPQGLDSCNGHVDDTIGYHYHAGEPGSNAILGCLKAEQGCALEAPGRCNASVQQRRGPPGGRPPNGGPPRPDENGNRLPPPPQPDNG